MADWIGVDMSERTCPVCNAAIPDTAHGRRIYCSAKCGQWSARHLNSKTCQHPGCSESRRALGYCSRHYNLFSAGSRHKKRVIACAACGTLVEKYPAGNRRQVCSNECRRRLTFGDRPPRPRRPKRSKELVGPIVTPKSTRPPVTVVSGPKWWAVLTAGPCSWCAAHFIGVGGTASYCSKQCARRAAEAKRGKRFIVSPRVRLAVYERDGWKCQLCTEPIDREAASGTAWSPSLDHITPQSHMLIADHSPANLRTAHMWCNSVRGAAVNDDFFLKEAS